MPAPIVSWYNRDNTSQITQWNIGVVDAGTVSADLGVLVWNNRGAGTAVSDMENCTITTKDSLGGNTGELVTQKWIGVRVDSMNESTPTYIGGNTTKAIKAAGAGNPAGIIRGTVNGGDKNVATNNYAELTLHANVPTNASAGTVTFLTRVSYQYT